MKKLGVLGCLAIAVVALLVVGLGGFLFVSSAYNKLVRLDQAVQAQWAQVENVYQRRADLVPNLVATVKGAAAFEKDTFTAVTEARAKVGQVSGEALQNVANDPQAFARFEQAQGALSSALSRLMVVMERYPDLKATANFRELQAQLEGTENRIAIARRRYIDQVRQFNDLVTVPPTSWTNSSAT